MYEYYEYSLHIHTYTSTQTHKRAHTPIHTGAQVYS